MALRNLLFVASLALVGLEVPRTIAINTPAQQPETPRVDAFDESAERQMRASELRDAMLSPAERAQVHAMEAHYAEVLGLHIPPR